MVSGEPLRNDDNGSRSLERVEDPGEPNPPDPSVLEEVLKETLALDADSIEPGQMDAIRDVAMRLRGQKFDVSPIGVALVEAILQFRLEGYSKDDAAWQSMSYQVAETLFETEPLRDRIEGFWELLCESVP